MLLSSDEEELSLSLSLSGLSEEDDTLNATDILESPTPPFADDDITPIRSQRFGRMTTTTSGRRSAQRSGTRGTASGSRKPRRAAFTPSARSAQRRRESAAADAEMHSHLSSQFDAMAATHDEELERTIATRLAQLGSAEGTEESDLEADSTAISGSGRRRGSNGRRTSKAKRGSKGWSKTQKRRGAAAFESADKNGDGEIALRELLAVLPDKNASLTLARELLALYDLDKSGGLNRSEFVELQHHLWYKMPGGPTWTKTGGGEFKKTMKKKKNTKKKKPLPKKQSSATKSTGKVKKPRRGKRKAKGASAAARREAEDDALLLEMEREEEEYEAASSMGASKSQRDRSSWRKAKSPPKPGHSGHRPSPTSSGHHGGDVSPIFFESHAHATASARVVSVEVERKCALERAKQRRFAESELGIALPYADLPFGGDPSERRHQDDYERDAARLHSRKAERFVPTHALLAQQRDVKEAAQLRRRREELTRELQQVRAWLLSSSIVPSLSIFLPLSHTPLSAFNSCGKASSP